MKETIPCKQCILLALCRHKSYGKLFNDCNIISDYILHHDAMELRDADKIKLLESTLHSTKWNYDTEGNDEGWGNRELQFYTEAREENACVEQ